MQQQWAKRFGGATINLQEAAHVYAKQIALDADDMPDLLGIRT